MVALWGLLPGFFLVLEPCCPKKFSLYCFAFLSNIYFLFFAQSRLTFSAFFGTAWFERLGALVVDTHSDVTVATLRDVNLRKSCVALQRYIVYVYMQPPVSQ